MKLLSRFIWLIIGISAIVFAGISFVHIKAEKEFNLIKASIKKEYDVQVDKIVSPEFRTIANFLKETASWNLSVDYINKATPDPDYAKIALTDLDKHFFIDGVWVFKPNGQPFFFKSENTLQEQAFPVSQFDIASLFKSTDFVSFYSVFQGQLIRFYGRPIHNEISVDKTEYGYMFFASKQDNRWIKEFQVILNADFQFTGNNNAVDQSSSSSLQFVRELKSYDNKIVENLVVNLDLPFLLLWQKTASTNNWLLSISFFLILIILLVFLIRWVIKPINKISLSLKKGDEENIQDLIGLKTEFGEVARMIGTYNSQRLSLESSENSKRQIIDQAEVGIIIIDGESLQIIDINPYATLMIGAPKDAILGNLRINFLKAEAGAKPSDYAEQVANKEDVLLNANSEEIPILRTLSPLQMNGKEVFLETFVDLRQIKQLQERLAEEKKKLSLAVSNSGLTFCEYDFETDDLIIPEEWNFLEKGNSDLKWKNCIAYIHPADFKRVTETFSGILKGSKNTFISEFRIEHAERGTIWINASILVTKRGANRIPKQIIGLIEDITERIMVQQELIKAKEKAEESDRQKSSYLANMSHKIRTPMNAIVGFSNLIAEEELSIEDKSQFIKIIARDTEQLLVLIDDIINIAKLDANQLDTSFNEVNANRLCSQISSYFITHEKSERIKLEVKTMLPNGEDVINTDEAKLKQVLTNLMNNAFKFTEAGKIEMGYFVNPVEKKMIFYVKDTGKGIPDESKELVFNRFYQVDMQTEGTGLGLTISKGLAGLIGGKLYFDSKMNEGSCFYVEVPFV